MSVWFNRWSYFQQAYTYFTSRCFFLAINLYLNTFLVLFIFKTPCSKNIKDRTHAHNGKKSLFQIKRRLQVLLTKGNELCPNVIDQVITFSAQERPRIFAKMANFLLISDNCINYEISTYIDHNLTRK